MLRSEKAEAIEFLKGQFERMSSAVFVDYKGMTVEEISALREQFRQKGVEYKVVKNTLVKLALGGERAEALKDVLTGMTGVAWSFEEPSAAARVVKEYRKGNEKLQVKAGLLEGQVIGGAAVESQLATMPSKDEARAQLLALFMAPASTFVRLINTPASSFVQVLAAKQRKDEGG